MMTDLVGSLKSMGLAAGALAVCLGIVVLCPFLAILADLVPGSKYLGLWVMLFFLPQYVFPYTLTYSPAGLESFPARTLGWQYDVLQWSLVVMLFGIFARRLRGVRLLLASALTVIAVAVIVQAALCVVGLRFMLDGP